MHTERRALAALVTGAVLIGLAPIFVRLIDVGYTAAAFWRAALALPLLGLLLRARPGAISGAFSPSVLWPLWLAGLFFAGDLAVWHQSIRLTSVANATLLANLAPVFVAAASFLFLGERFRPAFVAGIALAVSGAGVLVSHSLELGADSAVGDACGALSAVFYAGYLLGVSRARRGFSTVEVMFWTTTATALVLLPLTLALGENLWPQSAHGWAVLIGLALLSQVAGQGLIAYALAHLPAVFSAVGLLVQPVAAAVFAWMLLAEPFGALQALGGAIVLAGIVTCRLSLARRESGASPNPGL
jgi:drug/metabolite transporter (DMT)-like permease